MPNQFYDAARHDAWEGTMPWLTGVWKATLVNAGYTFDPAHTSQADIAAYVLAGVTDQTLTGQSLGPQGQGNANSLSFTGVAAAQTAKAVIVYRDNGGGSTRLAIYYDGVAGFPLTTSSAPVAVDWNNTPINGQLFGVN